MDGFAQAAALLPDSLRREAEGLSPGVRERCEELRLRRGREMTVLTDGRERIVSRRPVTGDDLRDVLEAAARSSLHTAAEGLRRGFITAPGGVRVGVCGTAVTGPAGVETLREFSSLALRVPRPVIGCADGIWPAVTEGGFRSLVILSPPGAGKTTLLRELIRRLSESGLRVCAADERDELWGGGAFDLGRHTDVLTGGPRAQTAGMLLRAMNPQVLAMDEITDPADARALLSAVGCGVALLATVHGEHPSDVRRRPVCRELFEAGAFRRFVTVSVREGVRRYDVGQWP